MGHTLDKQWKVLVYDTRLNNPWKQALLRQKDRIVFPCHHFSGYFAVSFTHLFSAIYRGYVTPCITVVGPHLVYHFHTQLPTTAIGTHAFRVPLPSSVRSLGTIVCFSIHQFRRIFLRTYPVTPINRLNNPIGIYLLMKINQIKVNNGKYTIIWSYENGISSTKLVHLNCLWLE